MSVDVGQLHFHLLLLNQLSNEVLLKRNVRLHVDLQLDDADTCYCIIQEKSPTS